MTPLNGIKVLDLSRYLPGPYCTFVLGDYGADIIKVEQPHEVRKKRATFGQDKLSDAELEKLKSYEMTSRNKKSLLLDMRSPAAREIMTRLIRDSDVIVSDYRPGILDEAGYGYEDVKKINPAIIYCAISLCGQTGPYRDVPGHDPVSLSIAGVLTRFHSDKDKPDPIGVPISDINSALHAVVGILLALRARDDSGKGQLIDIAMSDTAFAFSTPSISRLLATGEEPKIGMRMANNGVWRTKDDKFVCTTDMEPRYWNAFCEMIGKPDWKPMIYRRDEMDDRLEAMFLSRTQAEWLDLFSTNGTQGTAVLNLQEAIDDPHNRARDVVLDYRDGDGNALTQIGPLIKMSETPGRIRHLARMPGADTRDVLQGLGFEGAELDAMMEEIRGSTDERMQAYL